MFRLAYVYLVVALSLPSWLGAVIINTIILEKEMADGSHQRVAFWGDFHLPHREDSGQVDALDEVLERINRIQAQDESTGNVLGKCDANGCSSYPLSVTVLLESGKRRYEDYSDIDWELHRCRVSLLDGRSFSKENRSGLLSCINDGVYRKAKRMLKIDKNKTGSEVVRGLMEAFHLGGSGHKLSEPLGSILIRLKELSERADRDSSLVIEQIDTRMHPYTYFFHTGLFWFVKEGCLHEKPASKVFGTCASMSLTMIDVIEAVIENVEKGIEQADSLLPNMHSSTSQSEIDEFGTLALSVIDWLVALQDTAATVPIIRDSTLFELGHLIKERIEIVAKEEWKEKTFGEKLYAILPECQVARDGIDKLLVEAELLKGALSAIATLTNVWRLDAKILNRVLSSQDSELLLVAAGAAHAVHCAQLLENEGYEIIYSTTPIPFPSLNKYLQYLAIVSQMGMILPIGGETLKAVLDSRDALQERDVFEE